MAFFNAFYNCGKCLTDHSPHLEKLFELYERHRVDPTLELAVEIEKLENLQDATNTYTAFMGDVAKENGYDGDPMELDFDIEDEEPTEEQKSGGKPGEQETTGSKGCYRPQRQGILLRQRFHHQRRKRRQEKQG